MNKGVNGRWKDLLTPEDIDLYNHEAQEQLGAICAHWLAMGEIPQTTGLK